MPLLGHRILDLSKSLTTSSVVTRLVLTPETTLTAVNKKTMLVRAAMLALLLLLSVDAKGGGRTSGGTSSAGRSSSGGTYSASGGRYTPSGRYTSTGAAVPASCRGCYYRGSTGMFYNRIFIYSYLGSSYRCYSCGSRSGTNGRYSEDSLTIRLAVVRGKLSVKLRDQTGGDGATQLTLRDVNTTAAMSAAGVAFEASVRSKIVSDWAQWSAAAGSPVATADSLGLADDVAITVGTAPGSCTGPPPCEPLVEVTFLLLFEDPADATAYTANPTSNKATAHSAVLQAACGDEAGCSVCGVPSNCGGAAACSVACSTCATPCTDVLPSGRRKGPWDRLSTCSAVADDPTYTVASCSTFDATVLDLSSELGDEMPYDEHEDDSGSGIIGFFVFICIICVLCRVCKSINKSRQAGGRGGTRQQPDQETIVATPQRQPFAVQPGAGGPPQQVQAIPTVSALPVQQVSFVPAAQVHAVPMVATATAVAVPMAKPQ